MNVSALAQIATDWRHILYIIEYCRKEYVRLHGRTELTLHDVFDLTVLLAVLPSYLVRRQARPIPLKGIPTPLSGLYKAALGGTGAVMVACLTNWMMGRGAHDATTSGRELFQIAESRRLLIGSHEVCGGPPRMIEGFFAAIVEGDSGQADPCPVKEWLPDVGQALHYSRAYLSIELIKDVFAIQHEAALLALSQGSQGVAKDELEAWRADVLPAWTAVQSSGGEFRRFIAAMGPVISQLTATRMLELASDLGSRSGLSIIAMPSAPPSSELSAVKTRDYARALEDWLLEHGGEKQADAMRALGHAQARPRATRADTNRFFGPTFSGFQEEDARHV